MPRYNHSSNSFQYGELSPDFLARSDTEQYKNGAAVIENIFVRPNGGGSRRPGSVFVDQVEGSTAVHPLIGTKILPFIYSQTEVYGIWLWTDNQGKLYLQAYAQQYNGAFAVGSKQTLTLETAPPNLAQLQFIQQADIMWICDGVNPIIMVRRTAVNTFSLAWAADYQWPNAPTDPLWEVLNRPYRDQNLTALTLTPGATSQLSAQAITSITIASPAVLTAASTTSWFNGMPVVLSTSGALPTGLNPGTVYWVVHLGTDGANKFRLATTPGGSDINTTGTQSGLHSVQPYIALTASSPFFNSGMAAVQTIRNSTYFKLTQTTTTGVCKVFSVFSSTIAIVVPIINFASTAASTLWQESSWSNYRGWPAACALFESRLIFGSNTSQPDTIWGSRVDNVFHFMANVLAQDSSADTTGLNFFGTVTDLFPFIFTPTAPQLNVIAWLQSGRSFNMGTMAQEFVWNSGSNRVMSALSVGSTDQSNVGSARVQPVKYNRSTVFVNRNGKLIYNYFFDNFSQNYIPECLNTAASHIVQQSNLNWVSSLTKTQRDTLRNLIGVDLSVLSDNTQVTEIYQANSRQAIFANANGYMIGLTWDQTVKTQAWHRHIMGGTLDMGSGVLQAGQVQSLMTLPNPFAGQQDYIWLVVHRTINGKDQYMLEIIGADFKAPYLECHDDGPFPFYMDSAKTVTLGGPGTVFTGFNHLIGQVVDVLADGFVQAQVTVDNSGQITIPNSATTIIAGLPYTPTLVLNPSDSGSPIGSAQGMMTRVDRITIRLLNSLGVRVSGPDNTEETDLLPGVQPMDSPIALFSGDVKYDAPFSTERRQQIKITQRQPLPMTILGITARGSTYE